LHKWGSLNVGVDGWKRSSIFLKFGSEGNAFSSTAVTLSSGSFDGATSGGSLGEAGTAVVLVVASWDFVAFSLSDATRFSHLSPSAVSVTAVKSSEFTSKVAFFSGSNVESSVTTERRAGERSSSRP